MKVAPIIQHIRSYSANVANHGTKLEYRLIHTGQHYDEKMSDDLFAEIGFPRQKSSRLSAPALMQCRLRMR